MFTTYYSTLLEDSVEDIYTQIGISLPYQLDMWFIADALNISLYTLPLESQIVTFGRKLKINVNSDLSPQEQWEDFGHELCHYLTHYGDQTKMPKSFLLLQEEKAINFSFHFCIPTFMLKEIEFFSTKRKTFT
ncbi:ImmA/IrrE family metallo-endopeptidase [Thalassobacillus sp. C254]|uniref:ImmA/IrrE family metallo-endopeptidase n=1 Tax=Thalassobacillus sp. C254 TaxID=1225341 RepID=UPI0006D23DDF|nr:ImmA/IrrE family metallo-endopeptidase [Thalassobacillus sp. C254]